MEHKTLFVTDLDGTLLRNDKTISDYTVESINRLIDSGMLITYATARSFQSAYEITKAIRFRLPVITRNGTALADQTAKKELEILRFSDREVEILRELLKGTVEHTGFVTSYVDGKMTKTFSSAESSVGLEAYIRDHYDDKRNRMVSAKEDMFSGCVTYCTLIDEREALLPIYEKVRNAGNWECVFSKDTYRDEFWLEICPPNATKAKAVSAQKNKLGCDKLVVFGDSANDLSMFDAADESYAVENALQEVKEAATSVILSNEKDGVARFLMGLDLVKDF